MVLGHQKLAEIIRRSQRDVERERGETIAHGRRGERVIDLAVKRSRDRSRRDGRGEHAGALEWQEFVGPKEGLKNLKFVTPVKTGVQ